MKTSPISLVALFLSLIACGIALLKNPGAQSTESVSRSTPTSGSIQAVEVNALIQEALDRREKELIRDVAPKIVIMTKELGTYDQLNPKSDPSSIEEMVSPFFKMVSTMGK
ncbi:MAG: hypothetical protein V4640_11035 [Verrucomicrobiota bacterium]